ncbi:MAG: transposase family protein, partial [Bacteroidota bacterium]
SDTVAPHQQIITPDQLLVDGLRVFYKERQIQRARRHKNIVRFMKKYGVHPIVGVKIWDDLQTTNIAEARLPADEVLLTRFFMALNHLRKYPTEDDMEGDFGLSAKTCRKWVKFYLERIQALQQEKVTWPPDNFWGTDVWIITVDGTHCWINEPIHPEWSQDRQYYSHKFAKAGLCYELGICIATSRLVWMNGPFRAGMNDAKIFRDYGLRARLAQLGKKAIGDKGYRGYHEQVSIFNPLDPRNVKKFKSRALKRHETFNFMTKRFKCLDCRFRHDINHFKTCFESICVICQYQLEHDMPLYDVLIEDIM